VNRRRLLAVANKEWIHVRRDPRSLIVALVLPVLLLVIMGAGVNFDLRDLPFALCDHDGSAASRALREALVHTDLFRLVGSVESVAEGERLLQRGKCLFVLVVPPGMEADLARGKSVALQILLDGSDSNTASIARNYVEGALAAYSARLARHAGTRLGLKPQDVIVPVDIRRKILYNPALETDQFIVPGLIVVILVILGALLTSGTVVRERERGTFETLAASPLLAVEILLGKAIPYLALGLVDVVIAVLTGALVFGVTISGSVALFLGCSVVFMLCALGLGLVFSSVARTQQVAMTAAMVGTFLPSLLLSGFAFPIRNMPLFLQVVAAVLPATHFLVIARVIYLKGAGLPIIWPRLVVLLGLATAILSLAIRRFSKRL
jgi:ABC-2 type transport system permease protein